MGAFGMCERCAWSYCAVPAPQCRICLGTGRIDGGDIEGVDPLVVLRAALMALDEGASRDMVIKAGLLGEPGSGILVEAPAEMAERSAVGRAAGQLLRDRGLRETKERKVITPQERAERKQAKAAEREWDRLMVEAIDRRRAQEERKRRQLKVDRAAAAAIAAAHPDEYESEREAQEVFVALEEALPNPNMALHHSVRRRA